MKSSFEKKILVILGVIVFHLQYAQNISMMQSVDWKVISNNDTLLNPWVGGLNNPQISTIDLNQDQIDDLFIFDKVGNKILTYINNGYQYHYAPEYENFFPNNLERWVLLRDYNGDNRKDIFALQVPTISANSDGISVWKNNSSINQLSFERILFSHPTLGSLVDYIPSNSSFGGASNIFIGTSNLPNINDIDGDGDLDILTFGTGSTIEYHQNQSVDLGYGNDSLIYEKKNNCWGHFSESSTTNICTLFDTCINVTNPEYPINNSEKNHRHSGGSTILSINLNDDEVKDLLLGDASYGNIIALYNDTIGVNMNTSFLTQDTSFPNNSTPIDLHQFPACFYEDINHDSIKDLIVSPFHNPTGAQNNKSSNLESVWAYHNQGTNSSPVFHLNNKNLFQEDMIEVGSGSNPILVDINNDSLLDLIVSNFGEFDLLNPINDDYRSYIQSYINTGTINNPMFNKTSDDFQNISSQINEIDLSPTFGDLDGDNDLDVIIGDDAGNIHYFKNTSPDPHQIGLVLSQGMMTDNNGDTIDIGSSAKPTLIDIDNDNDLDLIIGRFWGKLNYYENIGDSSIFNYKHITDELGDIFIPSGNIVPRFQMINNDLQLFVGCQEGRIYRYNNITNNLGGAFQLIDNFFNNINVGPFSTPAIADLNNDSLFDMILGNLRGGLSLYTGHFDSTATIQNSISESSFFLYPNPSQDFIKISLNMPIYIEIYNLMGEKIKSLIVNGGIPIQDLSNGMYLIKFNYDNKSYTLKFIKEINK